MKRFAIVLAIALSAVCFAQTDNTLYVRQFPGADVGTKVANAVASCNINAAIPCLVVIDPSLAVFASGSMPTVPSNVQIIDLRSKLSFSGGNGGGSTSLTVSPSLLGNTSTIPSGAGISQPGLTTLADGTFLSLINLSSTGSQTSTSYDGYTWQTPIVQGATNGLPNPGVGNGYGYQSLDTLSNGNVIFSTSLSESSGNVVPAISVGTVTSPVVNYAAGSGPEGMDKDGSGNVWVANETANSATRYTASTWAIQTYTTNLSSPVAISHNATLTYILNGNGTIEVVNSAALTHSATITLSSISGVSCGNPQSIAIDNSGDANAGDIVVTCGTTTNTYNVYWLNPAGTAYVTRVALGAGVGSVAVVPSTAANFVGYTYVLQFVGSTTPSSLHVFGINQLEITGSPWGAPKVASGLSIDANGYALVSGGGTELINSGNGMILLYIQGGGAYGNSIDSSGQIWVPEIHGTVSKYSSAGVFLGKFNVGSGPVGMTSSNNDVWIADSGSGQVTRIPSVGFPDMISWGTLTNIVPTNGGVTNWGYPSGPIVQVNSTTLVLPVWYAANGTSSNGPFQSGVLRSIDSGSTWTYIPITPAVKSGWEITDDYDETAGQLMPNGDIVLIMRHEGLPSGDPNGSYARSMSHDGGFTWAPPVDVLNIGNIAGRPSLAVWPGTSNLLLVTRGAQGSTSNGTYAMTSIDEGLTWSTPSNIVITGDTDNYDALTANNGNVYVAENFSNGGGAQVGTLSFSALTPSGISITPGINLGQNLTLGNLSISGLTSNGKSIFNYNSLISSAPTIYNLNAGDPTTCQNLELAGTVIPNQICVYKSTFNTGGFYLNLTQNYNSTAKKLNVDSSGKVSDILSIKLDGAPLGSYVMADGSGYVAPGVSTTCLLASSTTITPPSNCSVVFVSGTTTISNITPPSPCTGTNGTCQITLIPTGLWVTNSLGNIQISSTAVLNKALIMTWSQANVNWYPAY